MTHLFIWITTHRNLFLASLGVFLWIFANYWYLRRDIQRWRRDSKPHSWSANMATKTGKGGRGVTH